MNGVSLKCLTVFYSIQRIFLYFSISFECYTVKLFLLFKQKFLPYMSTGEFAVTSYISTAQLNIYDWIEYILLF